MDLAPFVQLGIGGAALAVLMVGLKLFRTMLKDLMSHQQQQQEEVLNFFGNHMSGNVKAQTEVAGALHDVASELRQLREDGAKAHEEARKQRTS